jgi:hypothetical protein
MGSSWYFFIESKAFELKADHGGGAFTVRIYERGQDTLRSVFMGKESAKTLLATFEELASSKHSGNFVRTIREGETVFIVKRCTNSKGRYVSIQAIHRGGKRSSIIIPEGRNCSGWQGFGKELSRVIHLERETSNNFWIQSGGQRSETVAGASFAAIASGSSVGRSTSGGSVKGKEVISDGIPDSKEHLKTIENLNQLILNMGNGDFGNNIGDPSLVKLTINLQLRCGPTSDWSIHNAYIGDSPLSMDPQEQRTSLAPHSYLKKHLRRTHGSHVFHLYPKKLLGQKGLLPHLLFQDPRSL